MKVLHIEAGRHLYGGAKQVLYIMQGLAARGVNNLLACPTDAHIAAEARAFAEVLEMPMGGDADPGMVLRLKQAIRTHQPDIVHIHSRRGADIWGGLAARLAGVPCVLSRRVDNPEARWAVSLKYRLFDHVITISEGIRQVLLAEGLAPEKVSCVRSAVDPAPYLHDYDKAAFRADLGFEADTPIVGMVAQLIQRKGHRYLLAALPAVLAEHPTLQVLIYGRGPLEAELRQAVADQGLADNVQLMGFADDLPAQLGCLDLLVHPADMEGLGVSLLQASAARVPIIASRAGGMPEAVIDGENGLLIDVGDVAGLAAAMNRLLGDTDERKRMGDAGWTMVMHAFSIDTMCEGNLAIYEKVLAQ
ncbi:glycosyltransferase family 4 protein [Denitromonas halophila]|uniref:Glycosyltransferase family 4 protein n=1 Tax=Denitromonas halophila TaxID=1629404 RepID=A0A557QXV7_9RHOO|nr:glycosyltransferase family 4 protein [Denitromonas halophila]TVO57752.1 glycosyltransferase family 4 protein [Denitromonas halophila]